MHLEDGVIIVIVTIVTGATAGSCPCIPSPSFAPPRECQAGWPDDVCEPWTIKGVHSSLTRFLL